MVVHGRSKQREACAKQTSDKRICAQGTVCHRHVAVDDVVEALQEDDVQASAYGDTADHHSGPVDFGV